jgi:hypothetical protein
MCGNGAHALCALGSPVMLVWQGRGASHGRSRAELARGIDPGVQCEAGGEVTTQGVVGGVLSVLGAHGCRGGALVESGVAGLLLCGVGSSKGVGSDGDHPLGVGVGGGGGREGRE